MLIFVILEIKHIWQEKMIKELAVSLFLLLISFAYALELYLNTHFLPNPNRILFFIKPIGDIFMKIMGMK
ncbi:hypothetical protein [Thermosyntropha sp.]|uniref:hypothetical protein n=1 Tax=Thermosyntropha sp. TaxID=2740820 RepID=UPI0025F9E31B|nr:hypothetical protein [Thermosyntropha sp.]MBO8159776.1 hypothetical protein [Thermosyntropha sp.]